jgi:hypothetical protein
MFALRAAHAGHGNGPRNSTTRSVIPVRRDGGEPCLNPHGEERRSRRSLRKLGCVRVSNHEATAGPQSFETPRFRAALRMRIKSGQRTAYAPSFSRSNRFRALLFPSYEMREAERRKAHGCIGTRCKSGPMTQVRASPHGVAFRSPCAGGRSPLGAPPRRFIGLRSRAGRNHRTLLSSDFTVCELLASARNGGGRVSGGLPGVCVHARTRGTPHPALLKQCLAKAPSADGTSPI